ncbi:MAG: polyprenol monophosphomannose synthase [Verrucomicrobia bacterium]|nr:polyprenol monophosphomannose synthase [Verrucomicrobiota bacterium]
MQSDVAVIIPTYNEKENLPKLVDILESLPCPVDLLIVDDNSPDGTGQIAENLRESRPWVHVLHRESKSGLGSAYIAGFRWALERKFPYIMEMDGDLSHDPRDIPSFIQAAQNADLVLGSRYTNGIRVINWPLNRLMLSLAAAQYVKWITGMPFHDPTGGFKLFRRDALAAIDLDSIKSNGYSFQIELTHVLWKSNFRIAEVPIIFTDRFHGTSKMSREIVREALIRVWQLR